jgi:hypothetical protein
MQRYGSDTDVVIRSDTQLTPPLVGKSADGRHGRIYGVGVEKRLAGKERHGKALIEQKEDENEAQHTRPHRSSRCHTNLSVGSQHTRSKPYA